MDTHRQQGNPSGSGGLGPSLRVTENLEGEDNPEAAAGFGRFRFGAPSTPSAFLFDDDGG
jgi:hypothetical protein